VVAALDGFEMRKAPVDRFFRRRMTDWLYRTSWQAQPLTVVPEPALRNPAVSGTWFVFSNGGELGRALAQRLADRSEHCVIVAEGDAFDGAGIDLGPRSIRHAVINPGVQGDIGLLIERCAKLGLPPCRGFVHLWGIERRLSDRARPECAQDLAIGFLHLAQAAVPPPRLIVVTSGGQPVLSGEDADPAQAPLWGMIRTLSLEAPGLHASGLDLDAGPTTEQVDAVLGELDRPPAEPQTAYRGNERFVARLVRYREAIVSPVDGPFRLQLSDYGSPDQLRLVPMTRRKPGPEEVEISVKATALNFRDVLITLGMLKDFYEQELGIARAADIHLGFDCAGTITAVGERVTDLSVGDEVMAAAAGGTASHVTIYRECVTRMPSGLDFASGAAIPNVFLTAYHALVRLAGLKSGESVLIHAAAGGVGLAAVQIAQAAGAVIYATAAPGNGTS
jgi:hypothetical protein